MARTEDLARLMHGDAFEGEDEDIAAVPFDGPSLKPPSTHVTLRKSYVWKGAMILTGVMFTMGVATGGWADSRYFAPSTTSESLKTTSLDSEDQTSTWISTVNTATLQARADPRALSAAEFFQTPQFTSSVADKLAMLHKEFHGETGMYSDPKERFEAHNAAAMAVSGFIGNLSMAHPQAAMLLHNIKLDGTQQAVTYKILDHFSDPDTQKLGAEVIEASVKGMMGGRSGVKKQLQEKFGPHLDVLRRIKMDIFPKNFLKNDNELRGDSKGDNEAHFQMLSEGAGGEDLRSIVSLKSHLADMAKVGHAQAAAEAGRRLMPAWGIVNLIATVIGTVVCTLLSVVIPGKAAAITLMSIKDVLALVTCAQWGLAPLNWVGCIVNLINAVLVTIFTFV